MKFALAILLIAVASTEAHTRKGNLPRRIGRHQKPFSPPDEKIVGGEDAGEGEIPWQVSFENTGVGPGGHFCGGSIYNNEWVICAAHCVAGENLDNPRNLGIVAGELDRDVEDGWEQRIAVDRIIMHESYNPSTYLNDISLLHLATPIEFNERVGAIELPTQEQQSSGDALVSGWGTLRSGAVFLPNMLQKVVIPVVTDEDCQAQYDASSYNIYPSMICAGAPGVGGIDSCQGDSGGPMVCYNADESPYLCGIVSWGIGCALPEYSGVYTEVSYFSDWVKTNTAMAH